MTLIRDRRRRLSWSASLLLATAGTVASCLTIASAVLGVLNVH